MTDSALSKAVLALPLLLAFGAAAPAQPAFRVKDLNTTRAEGISSKHGFNSALGRFAAVGNTAFFAASDGLNGSELWRSDGTDAGTRLVADICPGACSSLPQGFAVVAGKVFFVADDGYHGPELWRSDGTTAGTAQVRDLVPPNQYGQVHGLANLNGKLLFSLSYFGRGDELWTSDGTAAGTVRIAEFEPESSSNILEPLARLGGRILFIARDPAYGVEYWITDGTPAGTVLLKDINPGPAGGAPGYLGKTAAVAGGKLFFLAISASTGFELWASDGTSAGTALVKEVAPGAVSYTIKDLTAWGNQVFFLASDDGHGLELWKSDGTAANTQPVATVPEQANSLTFSAGRLFFFADCALWRSDGTTTGTLLLRSFGGGGGGFCEQPFPMVEDGGGKFLFFAKDGPHGWEPWRSDGTPEGTSLLADLNPGPAPSIGYQRDQLVGGRWFFRAKGGEDVGTQLWVTDGTTAGTRMLLIDRQRSAFSLTPQGELLGPRALFDLNGKLLFQGGTGASGAELGRSDGTAAGTLMVKDLQPGRDASLPGEFTRAGGIVFFRSGAGSGREKLWRTDGTRAGTRELYSPEHLHNGGLFSPRDLTELGGKLLFAGAWSSDFDEELMKSDGTAAGTVAVEEFASVSGVDTILRLGGLVVFQGNEKLWRSDGTAAGTALIRTTPTLNRQRPLGEVSAIRNGELLFAGSTSSAGEELWRSDGTDAGTFLLAETVPGPGSNRLGPFAAAGPAVFFAAGGDELWINDAGSTRRVRKLPAGDPAFGIRSLTALGSKVYFTYQDNARGHELWVSDGTTAGTRLVKDMLPGAGSSHPRELYAKDGILYFSASDGVHGFEPWRSDGTAAGTRMIQDIAPGTLSSSPVEFTASGPYIYFAANDGTSGFELWAFPRP